MTEPLNANPTLKSSDFVAGQRDRLGREIVYVYIACKEYVIYRTEIGMRVFTDDDDIPPEDRVYYKRYSEIGSLLGKINSLQPRNLDRIEALNKQIARGIQQCLEGSPDNAKLILNEVISRLESLRRLAGRTAYLLGALALMIGVLTTNQILVCVRPACLSMIYPDVLSCGAIGGFLSVAIGIWSLRIDLDANSWLNALAGASRIVIAALAAVVAYFAVESNIVLGELAKLPYGVYMAAVIAGFSETFIPSLLRREVQDSVKS